MQSVKYHLQLCEGNWFYGFHSADHQRRFWQQPNHGLEGMGAQLFVGKSRRLIRHRRANNSRRRAR